MFDVLLKNATVVTPTESKKLNIAVKSGKIEGLFNTDFIPEAHEVYDYIDMIIFPGLIDSHSHVTFCDNFKYGSMTAASGGVTTIIEMPQSGHLPSIFTKEILLDRINNIENNSIVDCALYGGVKSTDFSSLDELSSNGVVGFKIFLSDAGDYGSFDDYELMQLFKLLEPYKSLIAVHAETQSICGTKTALYKKEGKGAEANNDSRPVISEILAVKKLCTLANHSNTRVNICHVSSSEVVNTINKFRKSNNLITIETCPHYLLLNDKDVIRCGAWAKCAPPIRTQLEVNELWNQVISGNIDMIGSDHATYSDDQKSMGTFWDAPGGFPGMDLILSGLYDEGVINRNMSLNCLANITSSNPARIFRLVNKGSIEIGKDADFAIYNPNKKWTFHGKDSFHNPSSSNYPYEGRCFSGKVICTFVRGKKVFENGKILVSKHGKFIPSEKVMRDIL